MLLHPASDFVCAVSANHYFLQHSQTKSSFKECLLVTAPTQPLVVDRKTFFTIEMSVSSNPKLDAFKYGTMGSREEIAHQCTKREGCGLNCILSATGKPFLLKFHNLIDHPLDIMFWSDTDLLNCSSVIRRKLKEVKDVDRLSLMAMR